jgi:histidine triad (HIT) family protein
MTSCKFCNLIAERPDKVLFRFRSFVGIRDARPKAATHVLIMPNNHVVGIDDLRAEEKGALLEAVAIFVKAVALTNYRIQVNAGRHQHIPHLHVHVMGDRS